MKIINLIVRYCRKTLAIILIALILFSNLNGYIKDNNVHTCYAASNNILMRNTTQLDEYQITQETRNELLKKAQVVEWDSFDSIMAIGKEFVVVDYYTGYYWACVRWMGGYHADVETVDKAATKSLNRVKNDRDNWKRRPVLIIFEDGSVYCASSFVIDHAGRDDEPYLKKVNDRSNGYGYGENYDKVKNNGANGHYCIFVDGCRNHFDGKTNHAHQDNIDYLKNEKNKLIKGE